MCSNTGCNSVDSGFHCYEEMKAFVFTRRSRIFVFMKRSRLLFSRRDQDSFLQGFQAFILQGDPGFYFNENIQGSVCTKRVRLSLRRDSGFHFMRRSRFPFLWRDPGFCLYLHFFEKFLTFICRKSFKNYQRRTETKLKVLFYIHY